MPNTSQIRQLQTPDNTTDVFPITVEEAIYDENQQNLSSKMSGISGSILSITGRVEELERGGGGGGSSSVQSITVELRVYSDSTLTTKSGKTISKNESSTLHFCLDDVVELSGKTALICTVFDDNYTYFQPYNCHFFTAENGKRGIKTDVRNLSPVGNISVSSAFFTILYK